MIRVLIVEDSAVQREFLAYLLEEAGDFQVVGVATDGSEAVGEVARLQPDIVLMDCNMPGLDGVEATKLIMQRCPTPIVLATASLDARRVEPTFDAIKQGALALVEKPTALGTPAHHALVAHLLRMLRLMAEVKVVRRWPQRQTVRQPPAVPPTAAVGDPLDVIALAGSTGAPGVIADILAPLEAARTLPILIVQHLAQGFLDGLVHWLDGRTALSVEVARHDVMVEAGRVFVAPDDRHLGITRTGRIHLGDEPPEEGFRPSATHLFRSVAKAYGPRSLGILLSGMGRDGAAGLQAICKAGGLTVAQDQASCVVFGMPGEAVRLGAARRVLSPPAIAQLIMSLAPADTEAAHVRPSQLTRA